LDFPRTGKFLQNLPVIPFKMMKKMTWGNSQQKERDETKSLRGKKVLNHYLRHFKDKDEKSKIFH
jgi:hypothetical protein